MFSSHEQLKQKAGHSKPERLQFLKNLLEEFSAEATTLEMKRQVLANLANFAYDPLNYEFFRELHIINLFLDLLNDQDYLLVRFSLSGLCNLALDQDNKEYINSNGGIMPIAKHLSSHDEITVMSCMTTLMFLVTPESKAELTCPQIVNRMYAFSIGSNERLSNLASIFLEDYCTPEQIESAANYVSSMQDESETESISDL